MTYEIPQQKKPFIPYPDLAGKEQLVKPGEYALLDGSDEPVIVQPNRLLFASEQQAYPDLYPGVHSRGAYNDTAGVKQVLSFLYYKHGDDGKPETTERVIIWTGVGYGVHPGHTGQEPSWYLVGAQIGTIDPESGQTTGFPDSTTDISTKHFSIACITGGPLGEPVLANPAQ